MERYEFMATTATSDRLVGLMFPIMIMLPILGIQLALFYLGLNYFFASYPIVLCLIILVFFSGSFLLIKRIQENFIKAYVVKLSGKEIRIWCDGDEILSGIISFCKLNYKENKLGVSALSLDIYTETDKIKFRARNKVYQKLTGAFTPNPLGTSESSDIETLLTLSKKIEKAIEE